MSGPEHAAPAKAEGALPANEADSRSRGPSESTVAWLQRTVGNRIVARALGARPGPAAVIQRDAVEDVRELLSYGAFDWAVTDAEATEALDILSGLDDEALRDAMHELGDTYRTRLLDNMPEAARNTEAYRRVVAAIGPTGVGSFIEDRLSYGVFDWAITDADATEVFQTLANLPEDQRATAWNTTMTAQQRERLADNLPRVSAVGADQRGVLKHLFDITPDAEVQTLKKLLTARFRIGIGHEDVEWEAQGLRRLWPVLDALPRSHVEGNAALSDFIRYARPEGAGGVGGEYRPWSDVAGIYYGGTENLSDTQVSTQGGVNDPLHGVNRFDKVVRHEVGHAVDDDMGAANTYCIGNAAGGNWQLHNDARTLAATMVRQSAGAIEALADDEKSAVINVMRGVINDKAPNDIDTRLDALGFLASDNGKATSVKGDAAIQQLRICFSANSPWYNAANGGVALGGRIYQEAYDGNWVSYAAEARARKVSEYQFRAPGEWFAEAYAAYYEPNAVKGAVLAGRDPTSKTWFDNNVDNR